MARRKRLGPAFSDGPQGNETVSNMAVRGDSSAERAAVPEMKSRLPPPGGSGVPPPPPIARVVAETATEAALSELAGAMAKARSEGRLVLRLALEEIVTDHLVRDRIGLDEEELAGLIGSIRENGQRSPIEVTEIAPGRYGLISGWRRMQALRQLAQEAEGARFAEVLALVRQPDTAADAYIAMVEENEIRAGLSYYERARIAGRAVELGVFETEKQALQRLFANASRARRSKIGSFLVIWHRMDAVLRFARAIPERLGLALEKAIEAADSAMLETFLQDLRRDPSPDAAEEILRLQTFVAEVDENVSRAKHLAPAREQGGGVAKIAPKEPPVVPSSAAVELRPGVYLAVKGGLAYPTLTLSGPGVDPVFRDRLEKWLLNGGS